MSISQRITQAAEGLAPEIEGAVLGDIAVTYAPKVLRALFGEGKFGAAVSTAGEAAAKHVATRIKRFEEEFSETIGDLIAPQGVLWRRDQTHISCQRALAWLQRVHRCEPREGGTGDDRYHRGDFFAITEGLTEIRLYFQEEDEEDEYYGIIYDIVTQPTDRGREEMVKLYQANSYSRAFRHFARHAADSARVLGNGIRPIERMLRSLPGAGMSRMSTRTKNILFCVGLVLAVIAAWLMV